MTMGSGNLVAVLADMLSASGHCRLGSGVVDRRAWDGISLRQWTEVPGGEVIEAKYTLKTTTKSVEFRS